MSLSGALSNAVSGLTANARGTSVISSNIANALNENYGRRDIKLTSNPTQTSGGVLVAQISRHVDPILAYQKRLALADNGANTAKSTFQNDLEKLIGSLDTADSLANKLTQFEAAIFSASSDPSSETRLRNVSFAAEAFTSKLRRASDGISQLRTQAEVQIVYSVEQINLGLSQLEKLNSQIMTIKHMGQDPHTLLDRRDAVLDKLSEHVPLRVVERDSGVIAVFTAQGRTLLDGNAVEFSFERASAALPHMTVGNGLLSQLHVNGAPIDFLGPSMMDGGSLAAQFELRDVTMTQAQSRLDGIARDMIERFGPGGPDASLSPGDLGVFSDRGVAFITTSETGIAGRIELNKVLDSSGTETWRWRDGLNAPAPSDHGEADLLLRLQRRMSENIASGSPALGASERSLPMHLQELANDVAASRVRRSDEQAAASELLNDVSQAVASTGVNSDQELQKLIELEKSYAANARVVQVVDDMLSELLRI